LLQCPLESGGADRSISNFVVAIPNAERRVGAEGGFEFIFAGFHLASLKITSL
jgi:hypothetical protein